MDWVVTYKVAEKDTGSWGVAEFFRGSEEQCRWIANHFAGGESDYIETLPWTVTIGPAEEWDSFLSEYAGG